MGILGDNNEKEPKTGFFSNLIKKIKFYFIGENESNSSSKSNSNIMTRENFEELVVNVFKNRMEQLTTSRSLLFHAKFEIYMHKNDYDNLQGSFGPTATDLSEIFHEIICNKCIELKGKNKNFKYTPHTRSWYFQFLPFHENDIDNGVEIVPQGTILAKTEVYTPARGNEKNHNINVIETQKVSNIPIITHQNKNQSVVVNISFDENNYKNLIVLETNTFEVPFKEVIIEGEGENITTPPPIKGNKPLAQLKWTDSKGNNQADIIQNDIKIAGNIDKVMDGGIPVLPLNNDNIQSPHVHIRYDESTGEFKIMAFAETKLNSRILPIKEWSNLPKKNTKILMGSGFNVVQLEFVGLV